MPWGSIYLQTTPLDCGQWVSYSAESRLVTL